jgi:hypothetical protein
MALACSSIRDLALPVRLRERVIWVALVLGVVCWQSLHEMLGRVPRMTSVVSLGEAHKELKLMRWFSGRVGQQKPLSFPAKAFWHIGDSGISTWRLVVKEQYERILASGMLDSMNVAATFVGPDAGALPAFDDARIEVEYGGNFTAYECELARCRT